MRTTTRRVVAYYRVSTRRQQTSGLGLQAQKDAVERYVASHGGEVLAEYVEQESGRDARRPRLESALDHCKLSGGVLVVAKLDRLARNVHFLSTLMESGVEFVACDMPSANRLTIHVLAAVAEDEAVKISHRTKEALAAARERGVKLGSARPGHWDGKQRGNLKASKVAAERRTERANDWNKNLIAKIDELRETGLSYAEIAKEFNEKGYRTFKGQEFTRDNLKRIVSRYRDRDE